LGFVIDSFDIEDIVRALDAEGVDVVVVQRLETGPHADRKLEDDAPGRVSSGHHRPSSERSGRLW